MKNKTIILLTIITTFAFSLISSTNVDRKEKKVTQQRSAIVLEEPIGGRGSTDKL